MNAESIHWHKINNIIFDLGGVIINIDYQKTIDAFEAIGIPNFGSHFSQASQTDFMDRLETGQTGEEEFVQLFQSINPQASSQEIIDAWNAILLDFPSHRLHFLEEMKKVKRTFLFSNTNEIHIEAFEKILIDENGVSDFHNYFETLHYSSRLGKRKPHTESFQHLLDLHQMKAEETLFIDDSIQHIHGAQKAGIQALFLEKEQDIVAIFEKHAPFYESII